MEQKETFWGPWGIAARGDESGVDKKRRVVKRGRKG